MLKLLNSAIVAQRSLRQHANKWVWLCFNKALFTKPGGGPDVTKGQFANLWYKPDASINKKY